MRPSIWEKIHPRISDRLAGLLVLFLIMVAAQPLRSVLRLPQPPESTCAEPFFVEIAGDHIRSPGVYAICERSDLQSLATIAGGPGDPFEFPAGLPSRLDLAKGPKITVRRETDHYSFALSEIQAHRRITLGIPLSLNKTPEVELTAIPGVGPGIARAIARERSKRGRFGRLDELRRVRGIGPKLCERIRRYLVL